MLAKYVDLPFAGRRFTEATINHMIDFVQRGQRKPEVVSAARQIVRNCPPKQYYCEAEAIFRWVKDNIRYTRDPQNTEWLQEPDVTLREGFGDCDCLAVLIASLAAAIGMQVGFETIKADPRFPDDYSHVYPIMKTERGWRAADPTVFESDFGWRPTQGVFGRKVWIA